MLCLFDQIRTGFSLLGAAAAAKNLGLSRRPLQTQAPIQDHCATSSIPTPYPTHPTPHTGNGHLGSFYLCIRTLGAFHPDSWKSHRLLITESVKDSFCRHCLTRAISRTLISLCPCSVLVPRDAPRRRAQMRKTTKTKERSVRSKM